MSLTHRLALALFATTLTVGALTACSEDTGMDATGSAEAGGGSSTQEQTEGEQSSPADDTPDAALARAANDGMPGLPITVCGQLDEYEYLPTDGNTQWHFVFTCAERDAFDSTAAALVAGGYVASPLVISEGDYVSERNYLQAAANGGSTEVQLNLVGSPGELEFEIYVTLTLP